MDLPLFCGPDYHIMCDQLLVYYRWSVRSTRRCNPGNFGLILVRPVVCTFDVGRSVLSSI